jgi:hypothetical protein
LSSFTSHIRFVVGDLSAFTIIAFISFETMFGQAAICKKPFLSVQSRFSGQQRAARHTAVIRCDFAAGTRVKVSAPVKIFHVGKFKEGLDLQGLEGVVQADARQFKGMELSATLPWKVQFEVAAPDGGKPVKVIAHLVRLCSINCLSLSVRIVSIYPVYLVVLLIALHLTKPVGHRRVGKRLRFAPTLLSGEESHRIYWGTPHCEMATLGVHTIVYCGVMDISIFVFEGILTRVEFISCFLPELSFAFNLYSCFHKFSSV